MKDRLKITKISAFDFDGTIVNTPLPDVGKVIWKQKTGKEWPHKGWWGQADSLDSKIFDMPIIQMVRDSYDREVQNPNTLMVMLTGRLYKLDNLVEDILKEKNYIFDKYRYNTGGDTLEIKLRTLNSLLIEYPNVKEILLHDDRESHIPSFQFWGDELIKSGRIAKFDIIVVPANRHD